MKKWDLIIILTGILLITLSVSLEESLLKRFVRENGPIGLNKLVITSKYDTGTDRTQQFSLDDIDYLGKKLGGAGITYISRQNAMAGINHKSVQARVIGTNFMYPRFRDLHMEKGGIWTEAAEKERQKVAVVDSDLALKLFGSQDVVGLNMDVMDTSFTIVGVVRKNREFITRYYDDDVPEIYIPGPAYFALVQDPEIVEIQAGIPGEGTDLIVNLLTGLGKNTVSMLSINYQEIMVLMDQLPRLQVFLIGLLCLAGLFRFMIGEFKSLVAMLRAENRKDYFLNVLLKRRHEIVWSLAVLLGLIMLAVFIWINIRFPLYIPAKYLPEDPTNISYFTEVIKQNLSGRLNAFEYNRSITGLQLVFYREIANSLFFIVFPLGLILTVIGLSTVTPHLIVKTMAYLAVMICFALLISVLVCLAMSIEPVSDARLGIVLWCLTAFMAWCRAVSQDHIERSFENT